MMSFFAALRFALKTSRTGGELGEIARLAIVEDFIPSLQAKMDKVSSPAERQKLEEVISLWEKFSDEGSSDSQMWANIATKALNFAIRERNLDRNLIPDLESAIVEDFYKNASFRSSMKKVDAERGPAAFSSYWKSIVYNRARNSARDYFRQTMEHGFGGARVEQTVDEDGGVRGVFDKIEDQKMRETNVDVQIMSEVKRDLEKYVRREIGNNKLSEAIYNTWMEVIQEKEMDEVDFTDDISDPVSEKMEQIGVSHSRSLIALRYKELQKLIVKFFEEELNRRIPEKTKKKLHVAECLAYEEYRKRLATWVLCR